MDVSTEGSLKAASRSQASIIERLDWTLLKTFTNLH